MGHERPGEVGRGVRAEGRGLDVGGDPLDAIGPSLPGGGLGVAANVESGLVRGASRVPREIEELVAEADDQLALEVRRVTRETVRGHDLDAVGVHMRGEIVRQLGVPPLASREKVLRVGRRAQALVDAIGQPAADIGRVDQRAVAGRGVAGPLRGCRHRTRRRAKASEATFSFDCALGPPDHESATAASTKVASAAPASARTEDRRII